jgi:hypothetical protein
MFLLLQVAAAVVMTEQAAAALAVLDILHPNHLQQTLTVAQLVVVVLVAQPHAAQREPIHNLEL